MNKGAIVFDTIAEVKTKNCFYSQTLTLTKENAILIDIRKDISSCVAEPNTRSLDEGVSVPCVEDDFDGGRSSGDMAAAISRTFLNWRSGSITCPGEVDI